MLRNEIDRCYIADQKCLLPSRFVLVASIRISRTPHQTAIQKYTFLQCRDLSNASCTQAIAQMPVQDMVNYLQQTDPLQLKKWFRQRAAIAQMLDARDGGRQPLLISRHADELRRVERGYGNAQKPEDYLDSFKGFLRDNMNKIPALMVVTQRPRDLTREQLKELRLQLDAAGYTERNLQVAWQEMNNSDIAASIVGFIRQAALGDALVPYEQRVDKARAKIITSGTWTTPQRKWLERIGKQLKVETIVDKEVLDKGEFKTQGGGFVRLDKTFNGRLEEILTQINDAGKMLVNCLQLATISKRCFDSLWLEKYR